MSGNDSQAPVPLMLLEAYVTRPTWHRPKREARLSDFCTDSRSHSWLVWKHVTTSYITSCDPHRSIYPDVCISILYIYIYYTIYAYILSIQHIFWQGSDILSDIFSDMLSYRFLGIIPDIRHYIWRLFYLAFFPGIIIFSHFIWQSIWHIFWHAIWRSNWHSIGYTYIYIFWQSIWQSIWYIYTTNNDDNNNNK